MSGKTLSLSHTVSLALLHTFPQCWIPLTCYDEWVTWKVQSPDSIPTTAFMAWGPSDSRGCLNGSLTLEKEIALLFQMAFGVGKPAVYTRKTAFLKQQGLPRSVAAFKGFQENLSKLGL